LANLDSRPFFEARDLERVPNQAVVPPPKSEEREKEKMEDDKKDNMYISHVKNGVFHCVYNVVSFNLCLLNVYFAAGFSVIQCEM
jgi:hypothetical protein